MATTNQYLYQYRWGVAAVGAVAVLLGGFWIAGRNAAVAVPEPEAGAEATAAAEAEVAAMEPDTAAAATAAEPAEAAAAVLEPAAEPAEAAVADTAAESDGAEETASAAELTTSENAEAAVAAENTEPGVAETGAATAATETGAAAEVPETAAGAETEVAETPAATEALPLPEVEVVAAGAGSDSDAEAPVLDLVRVEPGGAAVIAGQAEPNSEVEIMVDGEVVATTTATDSGEFVAFVETGAEAGTEAIQAASETDGGVDLVSADTVLVLTPEVPEGELAAPAVVSATEAAITVLQPGGLAIPDQVSLDSISYDQAGEAILAGRAQPLSEVRVYVDDVFAVSATASDSGAWTTPLNQVAAGRYILRVDEIGPDGAVTSRAETPFQKEYPENIAPFLQMANGKLTVQPGNTLWVMAREIYGSGIQYTQIFAANEDSIRDPDLIFPGQIFDIPEKAATP